MENLDIIKMIAQMSEEEKAQLAELLQPKRKSILDNSTDKSILNKDVEKERANDKNNEKQITMADKMTDAMKQGRSITQKEPLILFVGPASCGKSMILMSLVDYLQGLSDSEYSISANLNYILHDQNYKVNCDCFMKNLGDNANANIKIPLDKTVNEVLINVKVNDIRKCTMLEAPGEDFFDIGNPTRKYKDYIKKIIQKDKRCPIYYVMLLDLHTPNNNFHDPNDPVRKEYEKRLIEIVNDGFKKELGDRVILLYNKFDLHEREISDKEAMDQLFKIYYTKIMNINKLNYKFLDINLAPRFEVLPYISGEYERTTNDDGIEYEVYQTTDAALATIKKLWQKLK